MAEKDIAEKILESYNDVFADIINVFVFNGRQVVKSESLRDALLTSQYKMDGKLREQERDVAKFWDNKNIRLVMLGLENQSIIDKDMPLRVMGYDGAAYRNQLNMDEEVESKNGKKYRKRNPRYPVITLVLHFGMKKWKKPISLFGTIHMMKVYGDISGIKSRNEYDEIMLNATLLGEKFDTIYVDEVHDFKKEWINAIHHMLSPSGELVFFADERQNIYTRTTISEEGKKVRMYTGVPGAWNTMKSISNRTDSDVLDMANEFQQKIFEQ